MDKFVSAARIRRSLIITFLHSNIASSTADRSTYLLDIGTPVLYVNRRGGVGEQALQARAGAIQSSTARKNGRFIGPLTAWRNCTRCMQQAKKWSISCNDPCFIPAKRGMDAASRVNLPFAGLCSRTSTLSLRTAICVDHGRECCCEPVM